MRKYPVIWFYILVFGISWIGLISVVFVSRGGINPFHRPYLLALSIFYAIGPALAAVIVSQVTHGKTSDAEFEQGAYAMARQFSLVHHRGSRFCGSPTFPNSDLE